MNFRISIFIPSPILDFYGCLPLSNISSNCLVKYTTTVLRDNIPGFPCWGYFILSKFQNQFCACSAHPGETIESGSLFNTKMPAALRFVDYIIVRGADTMFWYMVEEGELDLNGNLF